MTPVVRVSNPRPIIPRAPYILDLYCGAGGAGMGYYQAGFNVVGVDLFQFKRYPFFFLQDDALHLLDGLITSEGWTQFAAIHASPPCQAFTPATRIRQNDHPDLIGPTRERLEAIGLPYVIENTLGSPLIDPQMLCGAMFPELRVYRHRLFETNWPWPTPYHPQHTHPITKMGRPPVDGEFMHVVGNFSGVQAAREAMGIDWMTRNELREAIPPAYTKHIGKWLMLHISANREIAPGGEAENPDYSNREIAPGGERENAGI